MGDIILKRAGGDIDIISSAYLQPILRMQGVSKSYGAVQILRGIDL